MSDWLAPTGRVRESVRATIVNSSELFDFDGLEVGDVTMFDSYIGEDTNSAVQRLRRLAERRRENTGISMSIRNSRDSVLMRRLRDGSKGRLREWLDLTKGQAMIFSPCGFFDEEETKLARRIARLLEHKGLGTFKVFIAWEDLCVRRMR